MSQAAFHRILLKLSGEALMGTQGFGVDPAVIARIAREVREVCELSVQVAVVVGGGNFIRGVAASQHGIERVVADHMGMLATVINALALQDALEKAVSAAINVVGRNNMFARLDQLEQGVDGSHAGCKSQSISRPVYPLPFQRCQTGLQSGAGGIDGAAVIVAFGHANLFLGIR